jgi:hypothetical protein
MEVGAALQYKTAINYAGCVTGSVFAGSELVCTSRSLLSMQVGAALQHITAAQSDIVGKHRGIVRQRVAGRELVSTCRSLLVSRWRRCSMKQQHRSTPLSGSVARVPRTPQLVKRLHLSSGKITTCNKQLTLTCSNLEGAALPCC